jgi:adenylate cyclase
MDSGLRREPLDIREFEPLGLPSFDIRYKDLNELVVRPDLIESVKQIRIMDCGLTEFPKGLTSYVNISSLDLSENSFTDFPQDAFSSFSMMVSLDLTANCLGVLRVDFPVSLRRLQVSYNPSIDLQALWRLNIPRLEHLWITHSHLSSLPEEVPLWAGRLKVFHLDANDFTTVPPTLSQFPALEEVCLFGNVIKTVRNVNIGSKTIHLGFNCMKQFEDFDSVTASGLNLSSNFFRQFPVSVFEVQGLRQANLANCHIRGVLDFECPSSMTGLDLSGNRITGLSERFVASTKMLAAINISRNRITEIPDCFPEELSLTHFMCDSNSLEALPVSLFKHSRLEHFSCASNGLTSLPAFRWPALRYLNCSFNKLAALPNCFRASSHFVELHVSFNELTTLPRSLADCRRLSTILAARNRFRQVPRCLMGVSELKVLSLCGNLLDAFPTDPGAFHFLKTLDLSNNHFFEMPLDVAMLPGLKVLSLSHNAIESIPDKFTFPSELSMLDLSFNRLKSVRLNLPQLVSLSLDYNELTEFDPSGIPRCHFLSLNRNHLSTPLPSFLSQVLSKTSVACLEYLGNDNDAAPPPPLRLHALYGHATSFPTRFGVGYSAMQGMRPTMEDAAVFQGFGADAFLLGVFDGHTGPVASATAAHCLAEEVGAILAGEDLAGEFARAFTAVNEKLRILRVPDGCTAVSVLIVHQVCFIAGIGDSRVVRVRRSDCQRSTADAKPHERREFDRLRSREMTPTVDGRIERKLAVARSLGDFYVRRGMFVEPDVYGFEVSENDIGMILACDGLWDVLSDHDAAEIVRAAETAADAAVALRNFAFGLGSKDNITVIVVKWGKTDAGCCGRNTVARLEPVKDEMDEEEEDGEEDGDEDDDWAFARRRRSI